MREELVEFGPEEGLVGTLTRPSAEYGGKLVLLLFNAGVLPRVGPRRINVKIARDAAALGHTSLRLDLSGHGDSRASISHEDFRQQAITDLRAAMDEVQRRTGLARFVVIGFCSGATHGLRLALVDERVVGLLMFDGHWYRTPLTLPILRLRQFRQKTLAEILRAIPRRFRSANPPARPAEMAGIDAAAWTGNPPRDEFARDMQSLADRGVSLLAVFSRTMISGGYYTYRSQMRDAFRGRRFVHQMRIELRSDFDHTLTSVQAQQSLRSLIKEWLTAVESGGRP